MAKTSKGKKRVASIHSRAARRATSPSLDLDKSLKNIRAPLGDAGQKPSQRPYSVLAAHGAGVGKKKRTKQLSRAQKLRQRSAVERADNAASALEKKVQQATGRHKAIKVRSGDWESLNSKLEKEDGIAVMHPDEITSSNPFEGLKRDEGREWMPLPEPGEELVLPLMMSRPLQKPTKTESHRPTALNENANAVDVT